MLGQTWEYVETHLTGFQIKAYREYWADHPPVNVSVAMYLGVKRKKKKRTKADGDAFLNFLESHKGNKNG